MANACRPAGGSLSPALCGLLLFFTAAGTARAAEEDLTPGRVAEKVVCRGNPAQTYALYLPSSYTPEKAWPVLYMLDARGRALIPIECFRAAAEEFGWILVSSFQSRSDTKDDPNTPAMQAMWNDTHARLALDGKRAYATGFSGGGRAAVSLARSARGAIAGVIGCGAGFPDDGAPIREAPPFPYFGTAGNRDFNYYEMRELDTELTTVKAPHRIEFFDGAHDWPPAPLARAAVAWMELQAMKAGARAPDASTIAALYRQDLDRAKALEKGGSAADASVAYTRIAGDFRGLTDASEAEAKDAELGRDGAIRDSLREARRRDERDRETIRTIFQKLNRVLRAGEMAAPGMVAADLGIPALRKKASSAASPDERLSAERILASLRVQTSFYIPERLMEENDTPHALLALSVAAEIDPDDPRAYYNLACGAARSGQRQRALKELQRAVDKGFRRFELLESDPDLVSLRADPAFQKWLAAARARAVAPASPTATP